MNTLPIYVVSIMKNEAKHIQRWYESFKGELREGDMAVLLDTGSTDDSIALAESLGITVFTKIYDDWSFSVARNDLREMLPDLDAWVLSLDVDEVMSDGWRADLDEVPMNVNRPRYQYTWNWEEKVGDWKETIKSGKPGLQYHGDKIVRRHSHRWVNRVHEVNQPVEPEVQGFTNLNIYHFADDSKSRGSYLHLLLKDIEENPDNDRNIYYAARELMFYGRKDESITLFKKHLVMPSSTWPPERGFSCRYLAKQVNNDEKEHWLLKAVAEYPWGRECWVELAQFYHDTNNWLGCYYASSRALAITSRGDLYLTEAAMWGWLPHDLNALAAHRLGMHNVATIQGQIALSFALDDVRLKDNLLFYKIADAKVDVVIPFKSNVNGLMMLVAALMHDSNVAQIIVVADGVAAYKALRPLPQSVYRVLAPEGVGISAMWNIGSKVGKSTHVAFINDDVTLDTDCITNMLYSLERNPSYGMVCPQYANSDEKKDIVTLDTCRGRYDGTGGIAGFCMMFARDLRHFAFDENMLWYWSDDDAMRQVHQMGRHTTIVATARCIHAHSQTINNDPPNNFVEQIERDRQYFEQKWSK